MGGQETDLPKLVEEISCGNTVETTDDLGVRVTIGNLVALEQRSRWRRQLKPRNTLVTLLVMLQSRPLITHGRVATIVPIVRHLLPTTYLALGDEKLGVS